MPSWILSRSGAWFVFGYLRSTITSELPGGLSQLMADVLEKFFLPDVYGNCFGRGVTLLHQNSRFIVKAVFAGFLADDDAHTKLCGLKGAQGNP